MKNLKYVSKYTVSNDGMQVCVQQSFHRDPYAHVASYRGYGADILKFFIEKRNLPFIRLKNETVAKATGCDIRTVQRWTNRFQQEGFLFKEQVANCYDVNLYHFRLPKNVMYAIWLNGLSPDAKEYYTNTIFAPKEASVIHSSLSINNNIYNKPITVLTRARISEAVVDGDGYGFLSKRERERRERVLKGIEMLRQDQKEWVLAHKDRPGLKELLYGPKVKDKLFTPLILEITALLGLNEREQMKLIAFQDEALQYAYDHAKPVVEGKVKTVPVLDKMGWFSSIANAYCKKNNLKPDWRWYYELCEILGVKANQKGERGRPLTLKTPPRTKNIGYSPRDVFVGAPKLTKEEQITKLTKDIEGKRELLRQAESGEKVPYCAEIVVPGWRIALGRDEAELRDLIGDEYGIKTEVVSHRYTASPMAAS